MYYHFKIQRWVVWWFSIGIVCGIVAVVNILNRHLTRTQEEVLLLLGVMHWVLGGIACYLYESVGIEKPVQNLPEGDEASTEAPKEWHAASDFLLPGGRQSLLPPKYSFDAFLTRLRQYLRLY